MGKDEKGGADQLASMAGDLAARAMALKAAVDAALRALEEAKACGLGDKDGGKLDGELRGFAMNLGRMAMQAKDLSSGARVQRERPMAAAVAAAKASGSEEDWALALGELAEAALEDRRPMWSAAGFLAALGVAPEALSPAAIAALARPILAERALGAQGYAWDWPAGSEERRAMWGRVAARIGGPS